MKRNNSIWKIHSFPIYWEITVSAIGLYCILSLCFFLSISMKILILILYVWILSALFFRIVEIKEDNIKFFYPFRILLRRKIIKIPEIKEIKYSHPFQGHEKIKISTCNNDNVSFLVDFIRKEEIEKILIFFESKRIRVIKK